MSVQGVKAKEILGGRTLVMPGSSRLGRVLVSNLSGCHEKSVLGHQSPNRARNLVAETETEIRQSADPIGESPRTD